MRTTLPSGSVSLASRMPHGQSSAAEPGRKAFVDILDVQVDVADRASVEAVLGQMQLGRPRRSRICSGQSGPEVA
jgi:hypothetical protein